jgi:hypothetical protein
LYRSVISLIDVTRLWLRRNDSINSNY